MEFHKLDLRVGLVKEVEPHPNGDKLYVLRVDVGDGEVTLVAGLRDFYSPDQLRGKRIVVVRNLQHKKIRGVVSQGMLLAADDGKDVGVLTPLFKVRPGTRVTT